MEYECSGKDKNTGFAPSVRSIPKVSSNLKHIQHGYHLSQVKCPKDILSPSTYAETFQREVLQQKQQFCSLSRLHWPTELRTHSRQRKMKNVSGEPVVTDIALIHA
jgi:hypothetical protein